MEHDLNKLAGLKVPASGKKAKDEAVLAAIGAFDDAADEKNNAAAQGSVSEVRPTSIVTKLWSTIMNSAIKPVWTMKPATMGVLATITLMPFGGLVAWEVYKDASLQGSGSAETKLEREVASKKQVQSAKVPAAANSLDVELAPSATKPVSSNEGRAQVMAELQEKASRTRVRLKFRQDVPKMREGLTKNSGNLGRAPTVGGEYRSNQSPDTRIKRNRPGAMLRRAPRKKSASGIIAPQPMHAQEADRGD